MEADTCISQGHGTLYTVVPYLSRLPSPRVLLPPFQRPYQQDDKLIQAVESTVYRVVERIDSIDDPIDIAFGIPLSPLRIPREDCH